MRSLAIMPVSPIAIFTRSPAKPWINTPDEAASNGGMPCASSPAMQPARTSPVPADERPGFANGLIPVSYTHLTLPTSDLV